MPDAPDVAPPLLPVRPDARGIRAITPTDVSQFIRLDQCRRYLRLRLHERMHRRDGDFMREYDVVRQSIPALLSRSGALFEQATEASSPPELRLNLADERVSSGGRPNDNARVVAIVGELAPGATRVLFQPRVMAEIDGWTIRGDIDILRLERDRDGRLHILIADMKSSTSTKVEHRLQVAFYHEMLAAIFARAGVAHEPIELAILYRGPAKDDAGITDEIRELHSLQRAEAERRLWATDGLLEIISNPDDYLGSVRDLVTDAKSVARQTVEAPFETLPWHLTYKCDGCIYNEFCMKWAAEHDDLSLLPHLSATDKTALHQLGIRTTSDLVELRIPTTGNTRVLEAAAGKGELNRRVATTWPIGPRIDGLVHRARAYRRSQGDDLSTVSYLPNTGHGSLPYCDAAHNPNLVRVYIDAQHDYLHDHVYLLGALVVASEGGVEPEHRRRSIVRLTDGPPKAPLDEEQLFLRWIGDTLEAIRDLAAPDDAGELRSPIHLIFFDAYAQRVVLEGLSRHFSRVLGATPLYDFMTQVAAFDSPVISLLEQEIRERRNFPMVCQSLQSVAAYLKFDWRSPDDYRKFFRARLFDFWGALGEDESGNRVDWYTSRSRFNSQVPLEYAYAAWGDLQRPTESGAARDYARFRAATVERVRGFAARRLEAIEHISRSFYGNDKTTKTPFDLSSLQTFESRARTLAEALREFVIIERHAELASWKTARLPAPERRVLAGETLLTRYVESDQTPEVASENREHLARWERKVAYERKHYALHGLDQRPTLTTEQRQETRFSSEGMQFRLRIETDGIDCDLDEILSLSGFVADDWVIVYPRWVIDERRAPEGQTPFQATPKQLLYGMRAILRRIGVEEAGDGERIGFVEVEIIGMRGRPDGIFMYSANQRPFRPDDLYTIEPNPNDINGQRYLQVCTGIAAGGDNALHQRLVNPQDALVDWPAAAATGQRRLFDGLVALQHAGELHEFEDAKQEYIASHGSDPVLLVQGPPGTGKSYSTAFALFARLQGAMAAGIDYRALLCCKTHAAVDVLLQACAAVRLRLEAAQVSQPAIFGEYFDARVLDVPLFRIRPNDPVHPPIVPLESGDRPGILARLYEHPWCIAAATPGGVYRTITDQWSGSDLFGHGVIDAIVIDEASQMSLPEALLAALPLKPTGQIIVVGDHRQMPPIVKHDWASEARRTFQEYRTYESVFDTLRQKDQQMIQFQESFRLHSDMAEFLRREIYAKDGIDFHSHHAWQLAPIPHDDPMVASILDPQYPLIVVIHDESSSQLRNQFEQKLIEPVLAALASAFGEAGDVVRERIGVVVPHRAQRAAVQAGVPEVSLRDPLTGLVTMSAVDTVERFQGGERDAILVSATESDPEYLLVSNKFLLDPRRLTVAISRARRKMVLVASRSVFNVFSSDEETFQNAQIWKNLLRHTCTELLWSGEREWNGQSIPVEVWGKRATD